MRRIRTGLLLAVALQLSLAAPLSAQVAPTINGESGLFELTNADTIPPGRFSLGLFFSQSDRTAAPSLVFPAGADSPMRYGTGKIGITVGFGLTNVAELTLSAGQRTYKADARDWSGVINGHERYGEVKHDETDKVRLGLKWVTNPKDPVKVALFGGVAIPTQSKSDSSALSTYRSDWDFGLSANYGVMTVQASYLLAGDQGVEFDVPNEFRWGLGFGIPIIPSTLKGIFEINRIHYDGGDTKPPDFSDAALGLRLAVGKTGITASGAVRANIDRWVKYGTKPSNIGGLVALAYAPPPPAGPAPARVPGASPAEEPAPAPAPTPAAAPSSQPVGPAPTAVEPAPAPKGQTSTTDEILFDAAKSRLTNIAKAILDGVALRLKNNLSASCTVVAYTDPKEKGGDHAKLSMARAEAAKDYLVKRHGIDAARIKVDAKGDAEAGADPLRNRRAVVTVTFP